MIKNKKLIARLVERHKPKKLLFLLCFLVAKSAISQPVSIVETIYKKQPHFRIKTANATYYLEKMSGGFSSIIDNNGKDWVAFSVSDTVLVPASAASDFRGVPNLVYGGEAGGIGHPGFNKCTSEQINNRTIRTTSKSNLWQWTWEFYNDFAVMTLEKADPTRGYWFLYEGPVNGQFEPTEQYWGTDKDTQPRFDTPELMTTGQVLGQWNWAYFGDQATNNVLWVAQSPNDDITDFFAYMGSEKSKGIDSNNGMNVFGFGRGTGSKPLLTHKECRFYIGFYEQKIINAKQHKIIGKTISKTINHLNIKH